MGLLITTHIICCMRLPSACYYYYYCFVINGFSSSSRRRYCFCSPVTIVLLDFVDVVVVLLCLSIAVALQYHILLYLLSLMHRIRLITILSLSVPQLPSLVMYLYFIYYSLSIFVVVDDDIISCCICLFGILCYCRRWIYYYNYFFLSLFSFFPPLPQFKLFLYPCLLPSLLRSCYYYFIVDKMYILFLHFSFRNFFLILFIIVSVLSWESVLLFVVDFVNPYSRNRCNHLCCLCALSTACHLCCCCYLLIVTMNMNYRPLLILYWIPKSFFFVSSSSIDVSNSPLFTVS